MSYDSRATDIERELVTALKTGTVVLGTRKTLKLLKLGKAKAVIIAANAPPEVKKDVLYYAKLGNTPVYIYPGTSVELGAVCGKPFTVMSLAIIDPGTSRIVDIVKESSIVEVKG